MTKVTGVSLLNHKPVFNKSKCFSQTFGKFLNAKTIMRALFEKPIYTSITPPHKGARLVGGL